MGVLALSSPNDNIDSKRVKNYEDELVRVAARIRVQRADAAVISSQLFHDQSSVVKGVADICALSPPCPLRDYNTSTVVFQECNSRLHCVV